MKERKLNKKRFVLVNSFDLNEEKINWKQKDLLILLKVVFIGFEGYSFEKKSCNSTIYFDGVM